MLFEHTQYLFEKSLRSLLPDLDALGDNRHASISAGSLLASARNTLLRTAKSRPQTATLETIASPDPTSVSEPAMQHFTLRRAPTAKDLQALKQARQRPACERHATEQHTYIHACTDRHTRFPRR